ncbi:bone sialoprotein 2 [Psammomys obesus]|uniref:bone sialoprotein 2 n=1 Tax=Psammomys obesus TaxID=48139 RepID=UPI0024529FD7|nr:bone sialoprotein 2 [Psammomys obesus]
MKTALILLSILGMACAFSMKNLHRRAKVEASEENGVFKSRPHYFLYKHAYVYPLKRFLVQGGSDSSEENEDGDSSEQEEEEETSNEEENNEESAGNEEEEAENVTLSAVTPSYGTEATTGDGAMELAALQLPKRAGDAEGKAAKMKESDEEEEEEEGEGEEGEEEGNGNEEAEVDENEQLANGTSANSTEADGGNRGSGGGVTPTAGSEWTTEAAAATARPTPAPEALEPTAAPTGKSTAEYWGEYEQTGNNELTTGEYEVYDQEQGEPPRGDNYRAYEDEYSYYKGRGYDGYDGQEYYYHQ